METKYLFKDGGVVNGLNRDELFASRRGMLANYFLSRTNLMKLDPSDAKTKRDCVSDLFVTP